MSKFKNVSVIGDGGWGTTLAILLCRKGYKVTLWSAFADYARVLNKKRVNVNFLKGINIPRDIHITADFAQVFPADMIVLAVPSQYLRPVLLKGRRFYHNSIPVISVVKGIENKTLLRMSEVIVSLWKSKHIGVLSGPTIAQEVAKRIPTAAVISSKNEGFSKDAQDLFSTPFFRIYTNPDIVGVEVAGSLKNIIAIACGISDGLKFGTNSKAAILTRGLVEMARLGVAMGGKKETFSGIAGLGDLVTTCFNPLSRNHFVGEAIGRGHSVKDILGSMKMVAEGVPTTRSAYLLGKKFHVDLPITNEIYRVLFKNKKALSVVNHLMQRESKAE